MTKFEPDMLINVVADYLPEESSPMNFRFTWSYQITILNRSTEIVQLLSRYWRITDSRGHVEEVEGPGVVGLQPIIKPGKEFTYTSFCQLPTPQGLMEGNYEVQNLSDKKHKVTIPKFALLCPVLADNEVRNYLH